jgi:hypothetical protein
LYSATPAALNGRGAGGAAGAVGAWAIVIVGASNGNATSAAQASSRTISSVCIFLSSPVIDLRR